MLKPIFILALLVLLHSSIAFEATLSVNAQNLTDQSKKIDVKFNFLDSTITDMTWCGDKENVLFILTEKNSLYRSVDDGFTGQQLADDLHKLGSRELAGEKTPVGKVSSMQKSLADKNLMLFLGTEGVNWITEDCGANFRALNQGRRIEEFMFHPSERSWMLASAWTMQQDFKDDESFRRYKELFMSKDLGNTWEHLQHYVYQFSWAHFDETFYSVPKERVIIAHDVNGNGHQKVTGWSIKLQVSYSDDFFKTTKAIVTGGNKFLLTRKFLFVAQALPDNEVTMLSGSSKDKNYNLSPIEIPIQRLMEHSYTILDSENSIMLHINHHQGDHTHHGYGNIYISDSTGIRYTNSLPGNIRSQSGQCDFEKVHGVEGIYLANVYDKTAMREHRIAETDNFPRQHAGVSDMTSALSSDGSKKGTIGDYKKTVISFDKGGIWQPLTPPYKDSRGKRIICDSEEGCALHLHSVSSNYKFGPIYTTSNSLGMILATGNVGAYLSNKPDEVNTYLSRDAGLTWFEIAKGSHFYEIGDHGSIIVLVSDQHATKEVKYSLNEGLTWETLQISDVPVEVTNIVIEPTNTGEKFIVYGRTSDTGSKGVLIALDFTSVHERWCQGHDEPDTPESDYETWIPNGKISPMCLLGRQVAYTRKKREAECFISEEDQTWKFIKNCECTDEDWECDLGFTRVKDGPCLPKDDRMITQNQGVPAECNGYYYVTRGYRKIGGDTCQGGVNHDAIKLPCPGVNALNSQNMMVLFMLIVIAIGLIWMNNKGNTERAKDTASKFFAKFRMNLSIPKRDGNNKGFKRLDETPENNIKDEEDDFGRIVFEETDDTAEVIQEVNLIDTVRGKRMTDRKGIETASKYVPVLNRPGEKKKN